MKTEMRRITGRRNERDAARRRKIRKSTNDARGTDFAARRRVATKTSFANTTARNRRGNAYLMFRVRGEELQRADGEPELVRVRELPDAHAEGNQLVARDARRAFHDILADVIHALRFKRRETAKRGSTNGLSWDRRFARVTLLFVRGKRERSLGVGDGRKPTGNRPTSSKASRLSIREKPENPKTSLC